MVNYKVNKEKVLFADESFTIKGVCFYVQKKLGRFAKEKQFADSLEERLKELGIPYRRELVATGTGNRMDFVVYDKILIEVKAKPYLNQDDFAQVKRYLQVLDLQLGLLINFWARSALPYRVLRESNS